MNCYFTLFALHFKLYFVLFEQKKLKIETLGEYLKEARSSLNLSLEEIAKKADIHKNFLEFLESGNFNQLPADVYIFGFLKKLAKLYSVEPDLLIEQYKKEKCIQGQISKQVSVLIRRLRRF